MVPASCSCGDALLLGRDDVAREHRQHRAVHRHRHRHLVERDAVEEDLHVLDRVDRDTGLADVADDARVVAVVAAVRREVERDRQARLPGREVHVKAPGPQDNAAFGANTHQSRSLSFAERVAYQRAIEDVYWRHRIWPKERRDPKPALDAAMSQAQLEKKSRTICAIHRRWSIIGNSRLLLRSCRLRWTAWRSTRSNPRYCASFLKH